ncbi:MAG: exonuclease SbcCD subunit D [Eubacteriales bacterium]|nr:exonuclease SbcCD subunit D [Eubacteriales bacterium]
MKLIHLSDLHIGKRVNEFSMLEDQRYILGQILSIVKQEQADGVILAGDIYDKPVPPAEAVQVFDGFLTSLAEMACPVFVISGNHDSAERLAFGARLMSGRGIYLSPVYDGEVQTVTLRDEYGEVVIYLLPFVKPAVVRHALQDRQGENPDVAETAEDMAADEDTAGDIDGEKPGGQAVIQTYQDAVQAAVSRMRLDLQKRNVLVAHQFVTGASRCESEEVMVGGLDQVDAALFDGFDYVALGHIHSPQHVVRDTVRYCGTPLKYSFSEVNQQKTVTVVELLEKGSVKISEIPLEPLRDMRKVRGTYLEVTAKSFYEGTNRSDYIQVTLTDEEDIPDGMQKLRIIYPNLMRLEYDNRRTREIRMIDGADAVEKKSELELFGEFYELQNNQEMSEAQETFVRKLIEELQGRDRL